MTSEQTNNDEQVVTCRLCGRPLTDPESIRAGMGEVCQANVGLRQIMFPDEPIVIDGVLVYRPERVERDER